LPDLGRDTIGPYSESGNRYRKLKAARSRAARIDEENPALLSDHRLVRVTGYHSGEACGRRIEVKFREVMKDIDLVAANLNDVVGRKVASPTALVVVAADRVDRCDGSESFQDGGVTDVATVDDEVRVPEHIECLGPNQTMGI